MRPWPLASLNRSCRFQSSPGLEAGCDDISLNGGATWLTFQSSPGLEAGCDSSLPALVIQVTLFQSSPGLEAGCDARTHS